MLSTGLADGIGAKSSRQLPPSDADGGSIVEATDLSPTALLFDHMEVPPAPPPRAADTGRDLIAEEGRERRITSTRLFSRSKRSSSRPSSSRRSARGSLCGAVLVVPCNKSLVATMEGMILPKRSVRNRREKLMYKGQTQFGNLMILLRNVVLVGKDESMYENLGKFGAISGKCSPSEPSTNARACACRQCSFQSRARQSISSLLARRPVPPRASSSSSSAS